MRVVAKEYGRNDLTIMAGMDFGHTDPKWILPLGVRARIDPREKTFRLLESPVRKA